MSATVSTVTQAIEQHAEAVVRLAEQAKVNGVQIYAHGLSYYATSKSQPGALHYVTVWSCDCVGFAFRGRCRHHAALLAHIGELPVVDASALVA